MINKFEKVGLLLLFILVLFSCQINATDNIKVTDSIIIIKSNQFIILNIDNKLYNKSYISSSTEGQKNSMLFYEKQGSLNKLIYDDDFLLKWFYLKTRNINSLEIIRITNNIYYLNCEYTTNNYRPDNTNTEDPKNNNETNYQECERA